MAKTLKHKVVFKKTTPKTLYDLYMNAKKHAAIAGSPVTISSKEGAKIFFAWRVYQWHQSQTD